MSAPSASRVSRWAVPLPLPPALKHESRAHFSSLALLRWGTLCSQSFVRHYRFALHVGTYIGESHGSIIACSTARDLLRQQVPWSKSVRTDIDHPYYLVPGHRTCAGPSSPCRPSSDSALERARPAVPQQEEARRPNRGNGKRPRRMQPGRRRRRTDRVRRPQLRGGLLRLRRDTLEWRGNAQYAKRSTFVFV